MSKTEIYKQYNVDAHGLIRSPGKFEGEMCYVPYFWDASLDGLATDDLGSIVGFIVEDADREEFGNFLLGVAAILLEQSDQGFVYSAEFGNLADYYAEIERVANEPDEGI